MAVIDGAIANVALPTIARDLNASPAFSIWIVNGYQLAITISLLPLASLGEIVGYRRVYLAGLVLFTVASLVCALSDATAAADDGAHHAGIWRGRHHERQHRAGALHLSACAARPRHRASMPWWLRSPPRSAPRVAAAILAVGDLALAVRRQRPDRRCRTGARPALSCRTRRAPATPSTGKAQR